MMTRFEHYAPVRGGSTSAKADFSQFSAGKDDKAASESTTLPAASGGSGAGAADSGFPVQNFIHKNVGYSREGAGEKKDIPEATRKVFEFVLENFSIPADFDLNHKFGPLSGITYERRVVNAYTAKLLEVWPGREEEAATVICTACGATGHPARRCPDGFQQ